MENNEVLKKGTKVIILFHEWEEGVVLEARVIQGILFSICPYEYKIRIKERVDGWYPEDLIGYILKLK